MMRKGAAYIAIAVITLLTSCHKDLCHDHTHDSRLEVRFDWSRSTPDGATAMRAYLFPKQGGKPLTADFAGTNGGMMDANYGGYSAIGVSQPDETTRIVADKYDDAYAIASETELLSEKSFGAATKAPMPNGAEDETVRMQPSFLYADTCSSMTVSSVNRVLTMRPVALVDTIDVTVEGVDNLDYVVGMSAAISGLCPAVSLRTLQPVDEMCTVPMTMERLGDKKIGGRILVFGHCPHEEIHRHVLTIYTMLEDGKKYYFNNEVTDKMHDLEHPDEKPQDKHIEIIIPNLPIPDPVEHGSFNPDLDGWTEVEVSISM